MQRCRTDNLQDACETVVLSKDAVGQRPEEMEGSLLGLIQMVIVGLIDLLEPLPGSLAADETMPWLFQVLDEQALLIDTTLRMDVLPSVVLQIDGCCLKRHGDRRCSVIGASRLLNIFTLTGLSGASHAQDRRGVLVCSTGIRERRVQPRRAGARS